MSHNFFFINTVTWGNEFLEFKDIWYVGLGTDLNLFLPFEYEIHGTSDYLFDGKENNSSCK